MDEQNNIINFPLEASSWADELLNLIKNNYQEDYTDDPYIAYGDWNDIKFIENNSHSFFFILTYNALYPDPIISRKVESSSILRKTVKWQITLEAIDFELEILKKKYPTFDLAISKWLILVYLFTNIMLSIVRSILIENKKIDLLKNIKDQSINNILLKRRKSSDTILKNLNKFIELKTIFCRGNENNIFRKSMTNFVSKNVDPIQKINEILVNVFALMFQEKLGEKAGSNLLKGLFNGDENVFMRLLPINNLEQFGKNELYRNLFPLFKLILLDKPLQSKEVYEEKNDGYFDYDEYKISKVKIILGKT